MTQALFALMNTYDIEAVYISHELQDVVAPADHHLGATLKRTIGKLYLAALEANKDQWCIPPGQSGLEAASMHRLTPAHLPSKILIHEFSLYP